MKTITILVLSLVVCCISQKQHLQDQRNLRLPMIVFIDAYNPGGVVPSKRNTMISKIVDPQRHQQVVQHRSMLSSHDATTQEQQHDPYPYYHVHDDVEKAPSITPTTTTTTTTTRTTTSGSSVSTRTSDRIRQEWVNKSIRYYTTVMREERRKALGQVPKTKTTSTQRSFGNNDDYIDNYETQLATKHYFALRKIKDGKHHHAERIYRRIINELLLSEQQHSDDDIEQQNHTCDHAKLAITTLLLALHLQRTGDSKATRSVFLNFFRIVSLSNENNHEEEEEEEGQHHQCACSAKVLQAYALFEMKQGNELKSLEIVLYAIRYDPSISTILNWKQFRNVLERKQQRIGTKQKSTKSINSKLDYNM